MSCSRNPYQIFDNNKLAPPFGRPVVLGTRVRTLTVAWQGMFQKVLIRWELGGWAAYEPEKQTPGTEFLLQQWTYTSVPSFRRGVQRQRGKAEEGNGRCCRWVRRGQWANHEGCMQEIDRLSGLFHGFDRHGADKTNE